MFNIIIVHWMHHQKQIFDACVRMCVGVSFFFNTICKIYTTIATVIWVFMIGVCIVYCTSYSFSLIPHSLLIYGTLISHFFLFIFLVLKRTCRCCHHHHYNVYTVDMHFFVNAVLNSMLTCVIIHWCPLWELFVSI